MANAVTQWHLRPNLNLFTVTTPASPVRRSCVIEWTGRELDLGPWSIQPAHSLIYVNYFHWSLFCSKIEPCGFWKAKRRGSNRYIQKRVLRTAWLVSSKTRIALGVGLAIFSPINSKCSLPGTLGTFFSRKLFLPLLTVSTLFWDILYLSVSLTGISWTSGLCLVYFCIASMSSSAGYVADAEGLLNCWTGNNGGKKKERRRMSHSTLRLHGLPAHRLPLPSHECQRRVKHGLL